MLSLERRDRCRKSTMLVSLFLALVLLLLFLVVISLFLFIVRWGRLMMTVADEVIQ